jgi:uncharacterized protein (TIGR00251 family)
VLLFSATERKKLKFLIGENLRFKRGIIMIIKVRVIPNSKRNEVVSRVGSILRVKIAMPAVYGRANEELCGFLSDFFDVKRSMIFLRKGERGREKTVEVLGRLEEELNEILDTIP